jgi:hypothetical protein
MLFGLFAVASHYSDLGRWDSIFSIIGGAIALVVFLGACVRWLWRKRHAPEVSVTAGDSDIYRREVLPEARHRTSDTAIYRVHVTRLQVRETNNAAANDVHLRVVQTDPSPADELRLYAGLQWVNGADELNLPPNGAAYVRLCEVVTDVFDEKRDVLTSVPNLVPGHVVSFVVEVVVDGAAKGRYSFNADWRNGESHYPDVSGG